MTHLTPVAIIPTTRTCFDHDSSAEPTSLRYTKQCARLGLFGDFLSYLPRRVCKEYEATSVRDIENIDYKIGQSYNVLIPPYRDGLTKSQPNCLSRRALQYLYYK